MVAAIDEDGAVGVLEDVTEASISVLQQGDEPASRQATIRARRLTFSHPDLALTW